MWLVCEDGHKVINQFESNELFEFLLASATQANFRRFQTPELEKIFLKKINNWEKNKENDKDIMEL
jgi:hypothetical protein